MNQDEQETTIEQPTPQGALALPDHHLPQRVYLIPVRHRPFMPGLVQPILLNRELWQSTLERVSQTPHHALGLIYVGDRNPGRGLGGGLSGIRLPGENSRRQSGR